MSRLTAIRLLNAGEPAAPLLKAVQDLATGHPNESTYQVNPTSFRQVPNAPFAYWVSENIRQLFKELPPFEGEGRTAKQGLATADDFRFVRTGWETPSNDFSHTWFIFSKGGSYTSFYTNLCLKVNWQGGGKEIYDYNQIPFGSAGAPIRNPNYYFKPGITWPRRSSRMRTAPVPCGCIFSHAGMMAFTDEKEDL